MGTRSAVAVFKELRKLNLHMDIYSDRKYLYVFFVLRNFVLVSRQAVFVLNYRNHEIIRRVLYYGDGVE